MTDRNSADLSEMRQIFALQQEDRLDEKIKNVKTDLKEDIDEVKTDLKEDIDGVKTELEDDLKTLKTELEGDLKTLKTDLEGDIEEAKEQLTKRHDTLKWIVMALAAVGTIVINLVVHGYDLFSG